MMILVLAYDAWSKAFILGEHLLCNHIFCAIMQLNSREASDSKPAADPNNMGFHLH
jgi:hypothetical protein